MVRGFPWRAGPLRVVAGSVRRSPVRQGAGGPPSWGLQVPSTAGPDGPLGRAGAWRVGCYSLLLVSANSRSKPLPAWRAGRLVARVLKVSELINSLDDQTARGPGLMVVGFIKDHSCSMNATSHQR